MMLNRPSSRIRSRLNTLLGVVLVLLAVMVVKRRLEFTTSSSATHSFQESLIIPESGASAKLLPSKYDDVRKSNTLMENNNVVNSGGGKIADTGIGSGDVLIKAVKTGGNVENSVLTSDRSIVTENIAQNIAEDRRIAGAKNPAIGDERVSEVVNTRNKGEEDAGQNEDDKNLSSKITPNVANATKPGSKLTEVEGLNKTTSDIVSSDTQPAPIHSKPWTRASANRTIKRALVHWATIRYIDEAFAVVYSARTIGKWDEEVILLTDDINMTESRRRAFDCLDVDLIFYDPNDAAKQIPSVKKHAFFYKMLVLLLPQLREYDVIYYMDLDMVILGPLRKVDPDRDFEKDVILVLDDNLGDMSIVQREWLQRIATPEFYMRFPGANETQNGPNKSPSGCAGLYWMFPKRFPPIERTLAKINDVLKDYDKKMRSMDQPAMMLAFWGQWRMVYHNSQWGADSPWQKVQPYTYKPLIHPITKERLVLIHTGHRYKPSLTTSPYNAGYVLLLKLASITLECPEISASVPWLPPG